MDSTAAPHVFIVHSDITKLVCDAWIVPTDKTLDIRPHWVAATPELAGVRSNEQLLKEFADEKVVAAALPTWKADDAPWPVLLAVPYHGIRSFDSDLERRLMDGLKVAAGVAKEGSGRRAKPLVALPLFGTSGGGADALRGEIVAGLLRCLGAAAKQQDVDVVLVLRDANDHALAQRLRRHDQETWPSLNAEQLSSAALVAESAREGRLVPFMGAGVSVTAGLPSWAKLIDLLLDGIDVEPALRQQIAQLTDPLDQALLLRELYADQGRDFTAKVAALTTRSRFGLAPAVLAGLPTREAVTLNYDNLYELASVAARRPLAVLPRQAVVDQQRWLLKLHGSVDDPGSIVLTREDYLSYSSARSALSSLAKAMLLTKHLLFVGFDFTDSHFHEIVHEVRQIQHGEDGSPRRLGTALMLDKNEARERLWRRDLDFVSFPQDGQKGLSARQLEIFLDCVLALATTGQDFLLDDRYEHALTPEERSLRRRITAVVDDVPVDERDTELWRAVTEQFAALGLRVDRGD